MGRVKRAGVEGMIQRRRGRMRFIQEAGGKRLNQSFEEAREVTLNVQEGHERFF